MDAESLRKEILDILSTDARRTPADISAMLKHPEKEIKKIIGQMEKNGTILAYKTVINRDKMDSGSTYCIIEVKCSPQRGVGFDAIAKRIYKYPEVNSLYLMSGGHDLLLIIEGKTMKDIAYFVAEKLATMEHVKSTSTHFLLKRYKEDGFILENEEKTSRLAVSP